MHWSEGLNVNRITKCELRHIEQTDTMLAFKAFSKHDLESMFSI